MIRLNIQDNEPIDRALKRFRKMIEKSKVLREYRRRMYYEKPSVRRRNQILRAAYRERMRTLKG